MISKFVDDLMIGGVVANEECCLRPQKGVDCMKSWAEYWQIKFNLLKVRTIILQIYKALIRMHLKYCMSHCRKHGVCARESTEICQVVPGLDDFGYRERLELVDLFSWRKRD